jgi:short chain dehydrogenase
VGAEATPPDARFVKIAHSAPTIALAAFITRRTTMAGRLAGKVAVITGASRGLGQYCAVAFAKEGAKVVVAARTEQESDPRLPGTIHATVRMVDEAGSEGFPVVCNVADLANRMSRTPRVPSRTCMCSRCGWRGSLPGAYRASPAGPGRAGGGRCRPARRMHGSPTPAELPRRRAPPGRTEVATDSARSSGRAARTRPSCGRAMCPKGW